MDLQRKPFHCHTGSATRQFPALALVVVAWAAPLPSAAGDFLSGCAVPPEAFWPELRTLAPGVIEIEAGSLETLKAQTVQARQEVRLFAEDRRLDSEWIDYHQERQRVELRGRSRVFDGDLLVETGDGWFEIDGGTGEFADVAYWLRSRNARGDAATAAQTAPERIRLRDARYTTCPPDSDDWWLSGSDIRLNRESGRGEARHVVLRFKNVPVLYAPYINFPIDDRRQTGVLVPRAGSSSRGGIDVAVPWYWNIAPNYDATLTPRVQSKRGLMLESEWRYLLPRHGGVVDARFLPNDRVADADRHLVRWRHQSRPIPGLRLDVDLADVSDQDYFRDFGSDLFTSSIGYLPRSGAVTYDLDNWRIIGRVEAFQILDPLLPGESKPYQRLPQLLLSGNLNPVGNLELDLRSELVRFDRRNTVTGTRFDLHPSVAYRWERSGFFLEPRAGLRFTGYSLDGLPAGADTNLTRTLPDLSLDAGLFLERPAGGGTIQTLEPRVFWGYVPYRNQDSIPLFDTDERDFDFDSLFSTRRFTGPDRVGDTHQITAALTTRYVDLATGREHLRLSAGQIFHLDQRRVNLRPEDLDRPSGASEFAAEIQARLGNSLRFRGTLLYDIESSSTNRTALSLSYQPYERAFVNLGYIRRPDSLEQVDVAAWLPLNERLSMIGRWNYNLRDDADLEIVAGFEYRSCCYGVRLAYRRHLTDFGRGYDNAVFVQFTLKGLAQIDTGIEALLRGGISGYDAFYDR